MTKLSTTEEIGNNLCRLIDQTCAGLDKYNWLVYGDALVRCKSVAALRCAQRHHERIKVSPHMYSAWSQGWVDWHDSMIVAIDGLIAELILLGIAED